MTPEQADQLIAAMQELHADNQNAAALAASQLGYTQHLHELAAWLVFLVVIFGLCLIAMLRPRGLTPGSQ